MKIYVTLLGQVEEFLLNHSDYNGVSVYKDTRDLSFSAEARNKDGWIFVPRSAIFRNAF